jgi:N-acetylglucosaminyl-diphospho-decaprenol L-rhamnosyltransferase
VTVIHDSGPELQRLLESLDRHVPGEARVVVVDTGSTDDGPERAREWAAEVVELPGNPGFGAANNAGVARTRHDVTALLNPDVVLLDGGLLRLVERARETTALLAPRLLNRDGSVQDSAHPRPGTARELLPALVHPRLLPRPLRIAAQPWRADHRRRVGWATAAALVARTDVLRRLRPFDPGAFLWYEDLDLCLRADAVELHPDVALLHAGGHSTGEDFEARARRRREVVERRLGPRARRLDDLAQAMTFARAAPFKRRSRAQLRALRRARG